MNKFLIKLLIILQIEFFGKLSNCCYFSRYNNFVDNEIDNITYADYSGNLFTALKGLKFLNQPFKESILNRSVRHQCFHQCKQHEYCITFSYQLDKNLCFLYNSTKDGYKIVESSSWLSVLPLVHSIDLDKWVTLSDTKIRNYHNRYDRVINASECMKICTTNSINCTQFTFDLNNFNCYISSSNSSNDVYFKSKSITGFRKNLLFESRIWQYKYQENISIDPNSVSLQVTRVKNIDICFNRCSANDKCKFLLISFFNNLFECHEYDHFQTMVQKTNSTESLFIKNIPNNKLPIWNFSILNDRLYLSEKNSSILASSYSECLDLCWQRGDLCQKISFDTQSFLCIFFNSFNATLSQLKDNRWISFRKNTLNNPNYEPIVSKFGREKFNKVKSIKIDDFSSEEIQRCTNECDSLDQRMCQFIMLNYVDFLCELMNGNSDGYDKKKYPLEYQILRRKNINQIKYEKSFSYRVISKYCGKRFKRDLDTFESIEINTKPNLLPKYSGLISDSGFLKKYLSDIYAKKLTSLMIKFQLKQAARMVIKPAYSIPIIGAAIAIVDAVYTINEIVNVKKEANKRAKICSNIITKAIDGLQDLDSISAHDSKECEVENFPRCINEPNTKDIIYYDKNERKKCKNRSILSFCELNCKPGFKESTYTLECSGLNETTAEWRANRGSILKDYSCDLENDKCLQSNNAAFIYDSFVRHPTNKLKRVIAYSGKFDILRKLPLWSVTVRDSLNNFNEAERNFKFYNCPYNSLKNSQLSDIYPQLRGYGYDRGHLVPFRLTTYSKKAAKSTFWYTNAAPQNSSINQIEWKNLEKDNFEFGKKTQKDIFIITGTCPKFSGNRVPDCFWKLICFIYDGNEQVIGFYHRNTGLYKPYVSQSFILSLFNEDYLDLVDAWDKGNEILMSRRTHSAVINVENCKRALKINKSSVEFYKKNKFYFD